MDTRLLDICIRGPRMGLGWGGSMYAGLVAGGERNRSRSWVLFLFISLIPAKRLLSLLVGFGANINPKLVSYLSMVFL